MPDGWTILIAIALWLAFLAVVYRVIVPWLRRMPGRDACDGLGWLIVWTYDRLLHRTRWSGMEDVRLASEPGPLIVVSNHTGAADPLLIQGGCRFLIRWLMASEMMSPALEWVWKWQELIRVDRSGQDSAALREAIRHVKAGGVIGLFPEGRIVNPPGQVWPFHPGVGFVARTTGAPVLLVWVRGTPPTNEMMTSLTTPSHARIEFIDLITYDRKQSPEDIADDLRRRLALASGWPVVDDIPPRTERANGDPFAG